MVNNDDNSGLIIGGIALVAAVAVGVISLTGNAAAQRLPTPDATPESAVETVRQTVNDTAPTSDTELASLSEFDATEHGDMFGVTGTLDSDFGGMDSGGSVDPDSGEQYGLSPYERELLDTDTGE